MSMHHPNPPASPQGDGASSDGAPAPDGPSSGVRDPRARRARLSTRSRIAVTALATLAAVCVSTAVLASASEGSVLGLAPLQSQEQSRSEDVGTEMTGAETTGTGKAGPENGRDGTAVHPGKANIKGEKVYRGLGRGHTEERVDYSGGPMPPVGGRHHPTWQNANGDVYTQPLKNEHAVHTLEHGAVWATYSRDATAADITSLTSKVEGVPYRFMSPLPEQNAPVKLTAWGHQLSLPSADDPRVDRFFDAYVQGPQTPEQGAPITGGRTTP